MPNVELASYLRVSISSQQSGLRYRNDYDIAYCNSYTIS